ncbi:phasin family protein [Aureimonas fodinaquatilis]|uniref:Phasin family protein n=1 Tax=Aureimonas fodinaquatilis TaxID=2565783 RepID=A0A5B0DUL9_9HYPH|nr:phasin family protein [Aureimonas fodinaquatilis]KAA0970507.1 phasin family protein [Aureimonas fodinaquatilis]
MTIIDETGRVGKEAVDGTLKSVSAVTKGFQQLAAETTDFTKRSYEQSAQHFEKLSQTRTLDKVIELQSDFAKSAYENWVSQATKVGEIYSEIAKESVRPFEGLFAGFKNVDPFKAS